MLGSCGLVGVFARYGLNSFAVNILGFEFPAATIVINILGSFLIGLTFVAGSEALVISEDMRIVLMAGLLGGFTTFSAFSLEAVGLFTAGRYVFAGLYVLLSIGGGISATLLGIYIGRLALN